MEQRPGGSDKQEWNKGWPGFRSWTRCHASVPSSSEKGKKIRAHKAGGLNSTERGDTHITEETPRPANLTAQAKHLSLLHKYLYVTLVVPDVQNSLPLPLCIFTFRGATVATCWRTQMKKLVLPRFRKFAPPPTLPGLSFALALSLVPSLFNPCVSRLPPRQRRIS